MPITARELHCPLCLKPLDDEDTLLVFKTGLDVDSKADRYKTISCRGDFNREITNFGGEFINVPSAIKHICLSHLRCNAKNLFWKEEAGSDGQLLFPSGEDRDGEIVLNCQTTGAPLSRKVTSEIIGTLRETGEYQKTHSNMWFPYPLLHASGKSSLVEMFGSKQVGKTILTLQLAHEDLYLDDRVINKMDVASYIFIHNPDDFKRELVIRNDWAKRPTSRPASTEPTPGDVRAIFIKPSTLPENISTRDVIIQKGRAKLIEWLQRLWGEWKIFFTIIKPKENGFESDFQEPEERDEATRKASEILGRDTEQFWHSVIFYDTAGESGRKASRKTQRVWQYTDKLVICIDAQEIFDQVQETLEQNESYQRNESIELACNRIKDLIQFNRSKRKKICLLVTKLDLIPDEILGNKTSLERIKEIIERVPTNDAEDRKIDSEIRGILKKWLSDNTDADKRYLINHFEDEDDILIDKVFFVWTEGLPKMSGVRISPIESFSPRSGKPGDKITIYPNKNYFNPARLTTVEKGFEAVKSISFGGITADILSKTAEKLEVTVPEGAKTGFIDMVVDAELEGTGVDETTSEKTSEKPSRWIDEATSEKVFRVDGDRGNDGKPRSYGMLRFLAWCVGEPIQKLVKLRPSQAQEDSESEDGRVEYSETYR
ncbi:MAG: hypothetical protein WA584_09500 [Pyrinomonadaceae bacterium]